MEARKRSYSPTIDDVRQYNIKRFKLLDDLNHLSLSSTGPPSPIVHDVNMDSGDNVEYIPSIEEYLVNNQSDEDVIESTYEPILDSQKIAVPDGIVLPDSDFLSFLRQKKEEHNGNGLDYRDMMREYYYKRNGYEIVPFKAPAQFVREVWERWYLIEFKLRQFDHLMIDDNDDNNETTMNDGTQEIQMMNNNNAYGWYYNHPSSEDDIMDID